MIEIDAELPIGTKFWFMDNNVITLGLVAAYRVYVTSMVDYGKSWHEQLFNLLRNNTEKKVFNYSFSYEVKVESKIGGYSLEKRDNEWFIADRPIYFSIDDLRLKI